MSTETASGMVANGISDRSQAGRTGKRTFIEYSAYLGDIQCSKKLEYAGNRVRARGRFGQFDAVNTAEFSNVRDRGKKPTIFKALSRALHYLGFFWW